MKGRRQRDKEKLKEINNDELMRGRRQKERSGKIERD